MYQFHHKTVGILKNIKLPTPWLGFIKLFKINVLKNIKN